MWKNMARGLLLLLLQLSLVCLAVGVEGGLEIMSLYDDTDPTELQKLTNSEAQVAAFLSGMDLVEVSSSVVKAESWLRAEVLAHYPTTRISTIVVGHGVLCNKQEANWFDLVLPSLKNMLWCLKRWGLENEIKLSASFSSSCLNPGYASYRDDMLESVIKPVLTFLHATNSTYSIEAHPKVQSLVSSHYQSLKKVGFLGMEMMNVMRVSTIVEEEPTSRKLISVEDSKFVKPYPARPTPLPEISPIHSSIGYSSPAIVPKIPSPLAPSSSPPAPVSLPLQAPPFIQPASPPSPFSNLDPPHDPPSTEPTTPPFLNPHPPQVSPSTGHTMPPCGPAVPKESSGLWCVAKPNVPAETLQVGMDYACGAGGADCDEIKPYGSCFYPDSVVAHASYAFNSYWQKHKKQGGSCSFGDTAMLINADPSFKHCRFVLG